MFTGQRLTRWLVASALVLTLLPIGLARAATDVAEPFRAYYDQHQGMRVLGYPLTGLLRVGGYDAQYFEKGRIEDHRDTVRDPAWQFMYGRLTADLMERDPGGAVNATSLSYADLRYASGPAYRHPAPAGFTGGTQRVANGVFVPYDAQLRPAPGYIVTPQFWSYINRADLFPGGWLHDIGLPMTDPLLVSTTKQGEYREITLQAFERSVLTYDPRNPAQWQVERGNIGADSLRTLAPIGAVEVPAQNAQVTLPIHLLARVGTPGMQVTAVLRWQNGVELENSFTVLRGEDGRGLVIGNVDWINTLAPPQPATQPATLELRTAAGVVLAHRQLTVLSPKDPRVQEIDVYWVVSTNDLVVGPQLRQVVRTERIGTAALEELLWGPPPISQIGYSTALPTPEQVLRYPGREAGWGPRVTLRKLTIRDGVATADFSQELRAYGGGSARVMLIRQQIARTLLQFPSVREVRIAIEGQTEAVLEP